MHTMVSYLVTRLRKHTKAEGLSLSVVVVAAIALLVLVVLTIVFAGRMGLFGEGMDHCDTICVQTSAECDALGYTVPSYMGRCADNQGNSFTSGGYCCRSQRNI